MNLENIIKIRLVCHQVLANPGYLATPGKTYCNIAFYEIMKKFNLHNHFFNTKEKRIMMANEIMDSLINKFPKVHIEDVKQKIIEGKQIFVAGIKENPHGHITVIYPVKSFVYSAKWKLEVPLCANVGIENAIMGLNYAFKNIPLFFEIPL